MKQIDSITIKQIDYGTSEYKEELELRHRILTKPIGLNLFNENLLMEAKDYHICAFNENRIIGVAILTNFDDGVAKMKHLAIDETLQGQRIGSKVVEFAESLAVKNGFREIILDARKGAVNFYQRLGYKKISSEFVDIGIKHIKMKKVILDIK